LPEPGAPKIIMFNINSFQFSEFKNIYSTIP